jgi:hypothetical protein
MSRIILHVERDDSRVEDRVKLFKRLIEYNAPAIVFEVSTYECYLQRLKQNIQTSYYHAYITNFGTV